MSELAIPRSEPKKQRYFTPQLLHEAIKDGIRRGFNQCLKWSAVKTRIRRGDRLPASMIMRHHHIAGKPAPLHFRTWVQLGPDSGDGGLMDITPKLWKRLPVVAVRLDGCKADLKKGDC